MQKQSLAERSIVLLPEPVSVGRARALVTGLLVEAGRQQWQDAAELAVSEVVTNAVLHAHSPVTLTAVVETDLVRVEVTDQNPSLPSPRHYGEQASTGRGMALVAAVAKSFGVTSYGPLGKVVWFTVGDVETEDPGDLAALLEEWDDVGAGATEGVPEPPAAVRVTLLGLPPSLWRAARQHHDALLRELVLLGDTAGALPRELAMADSARSGLLGALDQAVGHDHGPALAGAPVLPHTPAAVDLELPLVAADADAYALLQDLLDRAERLAAAGRLLAKPGLPEVIAVRRWVCDQVIAQLAGGVPAPWTGTDSERFVALPPGPAAALAWDVSVVRDSQAGAVAADDAGRIIAVSRPLATALGWNPADLVGRRIIALVPARYREAHIAGFTRYLSTGQARILGVALELPFLHRDGRDVVFNFHLEAHGTATGATVYLAKVVLPAA